MRTKQSYTLSDLAAKLKCKLEGDPQKRISGVSDLDQATSEDVSFFSNARYAQALKSSQAGLLIVDASTSLDEQKNYLISPNPSETFQALIELFHPPHKFPSEFLGIHPTAIIHSSAQLDSTVNVGPYAVIDGNVTIGSNTFIGSGVYIGPNVQIGKDCLIHPHAVIREDCIIKDRVIIQPGAVIGSCGFGYITSSQGTHQKLNQVGNVAIDSDCEIGANTTIDRARFKSTDIGQGTKIDNLVQIGHGARVGKHNIIVAQCAIAGSTTLGQYVILAGQVAIAGHIILDDFVKIAAKSGVTKSLSKGTYGGFPAIAIEEHNRNHVMLRNIKKFVDQLKTIESKVIELEKQRG